MKKNIDSPGPDFSTLLRGVLDFSTHVGAAVAHAIDLGFERVQAELDPAGARAFVLRMAYAKEPNSAAVMAVDGDGTPEEFVEVLQRMGTVKSIFDLVSVPDAGQWLTGDLTPTIDDLARAFLRAYTWGKRAEELKRELRVRMEQQGRLALEVPGIGAVTYCPATDRKDVDDGATQALLTELAEKLAAHGEVVDDELPRKATPIGATIKVTLAP